MKVCEKVRQKGTTSYNEVADELVAEFTGTPYKPNQEQVRQLIDVIPASGIFFEA